MSFVTTIQKLKYASYVMPATFAMVMVLILKFNIHEYVDRILGGDIDRHALSSSVFGVPKHLQEKGYRPFYTDGETPGWDGQFYYYIANDIFDEKHSSQHVDAPAYRWQRVGLAIWSAALSKSAGHDWVSPREMIDSYVLLYALGLLALCWLYRYHWVPWPYLFLWPFSVMTQITIMNGLPDTAADAFVFISLFFLFKEYLPGYMIFMSFAVLSREGYILLAFFLFLGFFYEGIKNNKLFNKLNIAQLVYMVIPGLVFLIWQIWIRIHFGAAPASQAWGMIEWPLAGWIYGLNGSKSKIDYINVLSSVFLLSYVVWIFAKSLLNKEVFKIDFRHRALFVSLVTLCALYYCLGSGVTMHWSGFLKPMSFLLAMIPIFVVVTKNKFHKVLQMVMLLMTLASFVLLYRDKIGIWYN